MTETHPIYEVTYFEEVIEIGISSETTQEIEAVLNDLSASDWLRWALRSALHRDPIDAANDACVLELLLESRADEILKNHTFPV